MLAKVCVIGLGYIGLPTAGLLAKNGFDVVGVDIKKDVIDLLQNKQFSIKEPGIKELLFSEESKENEKGKGNLRYSDKPEEADIFLITVQTPLLGENKTPDLSYVVNAVKSISPYLKKGNLVILESTCPPKTTSGLIGGLLENLGFIPGEDIYLAYCPERVLPGNILHELIYNPRVIGGVNEGSTKIAGKFYSSFVKGDLLFTDSTTAEMSKLMENTYRDVNIALSNRLAIMSEDLGVNAWEVIKLANRHPRVNLHKPGPGVGGHCIAVDPWFIANSVPSSPLITLARKINDGMPEFVVNKVMKYLQEHYLYWEVLPKVSILGMSYKGGTDDCRESPSLDILRLFKKQAVEVSCYDPYIKETDLHDTVKDSSMIIVVADHKEFFNLSPDVLGELMRDKVVFDTRNCLDKKAWLQAGFEYILLGKNGSEQSSKYSMKYKLEVLCQKIFCLLALFGIERGYCLDICNI